MHGSGKGTEIELLYVGVPRNCIALLCCRLRFDNRSDDALRCYYCCGCRFSISLVRSHSLLYASCGIHEEHSYELLGNSEIVFTLPSFCFPSSPFHPPLFVLLFLNPTFHGQSLIGLLGAGASKGDGPPPTLNASAPPFFPTKPRILWPEGDVWLTLRNPSHVFHWAFHITVSIDRISPSSSTFSRALYKRAVFILNAFRMRWNRCTRCRTLTGASRLREASDRWLRLFDYKRQCSRDTFRTAYSMDQCTRVLFGRKRFSPLRPLGYLSHEMAAENLQKFLFEWHRLRHIFLDQCPTPRPIPGNSRPRLKTLNILVWNVGSNVNSEPQHSILLESLKANQIDIACLQEFRNTDILLPLHSLRPVSVWPSTFHRIGSDQVPHVYGGSMIASRLGYLSRHKTPFLGSIEFNSVCVSENFHVINVYLPFSTEMRGRYDDTSFLSFTHSLSSCLDSSTLIVGDFNTNILRPPFKTSRGLTLQHLLDHGFEIMNPVDSSGSYLQTHYNAGARIGACIDLVLWKGPIGCRHTVRDINVERLALNSRDHYGLVVRVNGTFPRSKHKKVPASAFLAFAKCLDSPYPRSLPGAPLSPSEVLNKSAHDLWSTLEKDGIPFSESFLTERVALWHNSKSKQHDPLFQKYFVLCSSVIQIRESIRQTRSVRKFRSMCPKLKSLLSHQSYVRSAITSRIRSKAAAGAARAAILSGDDSTVRRFLLQSLNTKSRCLDLSSLTPEEFERFRTFYSECWDPPNTPPTDLSFLDSLAPSVSRIPSAVDFDISGECSDDELAEALSFLRNGKAPGPSLIPVDFYKIANSDPSVSKFILSQVNACLSGDRPSSMDACRLVLIFKKGSRSDPSNWRPINLTNSIFRICESVIYRRLLQWSERVLSPNAFGFRPGRRAEDVCYLLSNHLHRADSARQPAHLLSLDIAKAFDTVPHDQLLTSLLRAGLSKLSVKIIAGMLMGHTCIVGDPSNPSRSFNVFIKRGVLQGGILSPLLFNIFFDQSLLTLVPGIHPFSYADDVSAIHFGPSIDINESSASQKHHMSLFQSRSIALRAPIDGPALVLGDEEEEEIPLTATQRSLTCRVQVNSWLQERDEWLQSRHMRHNPSKSEAVVMHCSHDGLPPIKMPSGVVPIRNSVTILGVSPLSSGYCSRLGARSSAVSAAQLFVKAWLKLKFHVNLQELRCLLMAFVYSHSVFGSCLEQFSPSRTISAPMTICIRSALHAHASVNSVSLYEFMGMMLPSMRVMSLRVGFLMRCLNPASPQLIRDEFFHHRMKSPWFITCLNSLSSLPQPKAGLPLCDRLSTCIETLTSPDVDLPASFSHPLPDDLHAVLVTDGSAAVPEHASAGPAGWGYILFHKGRTYRACGSLGLSTSDNAESMALFEGLSLGQSLGAPFIHVRTDNSGCKELLDGTAFPHSPGCIRLYLFLMKVTAQIFPYKVFSHSITSHRDILNDVADELAARGRNGLSWHEISDTTDEHIAFLRKPIPRINPGKEGEEPLPLQPIETAHSTALSSFHHAVRSSISASQFLKHFENVKCNFRWLNFPGSPPAIVKASIMNQQYLYHLRYDLHAHFERQHMNHFCTPCAFCGSCDNSSAHRVFNCSTSSRHMSTRDILSLSVYRRAICAYRACYTSLLPLDDDGFDYPRSDFDYLQWLSSPHMLIFTPSELIVRPLTPHEMQSLADASYRFHLLYTKYSAILAANSENPEVASLPKVPSRAANARSPTPSDCQIICTRLKQCRLFDEVVDWFRWHNYSESATNSIVRRNTGYGGFLPCSLLRVYMKLEVTLSACLCVYKEAQCRILGENSRPGISNLGLPSKVYNLLREGNHMNVPVTKHSFVKKPDNTHIDMPDFFYHLPFHYLNSSPIVEAWFAAPSLRDRRGLIDWPTHADVGKTIPCPIWKLYNFEEIQTTMKGLILRTGSGNDKGPRLTPHPQIEFIYDALNLAIEYGNIRIIWRPRFKLLLDTAAKSAAVLIRRQLIFSLIFGSVIDVENYSPRDAILGHSYFFSSTVLEVLCIPVCHQPRKISHIAGLSLPVRGIPPHAPKRSVYLGVKSQIDDYRMVLSLPVRDSEPTIRQTDMTDASAAIARRSAAAAITAMVDSATTWARELINSHRDPACPNCKVFPTLDVPASVSSEEVDLSSHLSGIFDDIQDHDADAPHHLSDEE